MNIKTERKRLLPHPKEPDMKISGKLAEQGLHAFDGEPRIRDGVPVPRLWVVVADREKAHVYRKTTGHMERIADLKKGHSKSHPEDAGPQGALPHGYDPRSEKRHHADSAFIQKLAKWLDDAAREKVFDRIVLVASPHTLGDIRACLSKNVHDHVATEIDKDLIKLPDREIEERLSKIAWF